MSYAAIYRTTLSIVGLDLSSSFSQRRFPVKHGFMTAKILKYGAALPQAPASHREQSPSTSHFAARPGRSGKAARQPRKEHHRRSAPISNSVKGKNRGVRMSFLGGPGMPVLCVSFVSVLHLLGLGLVFENVRAIFDAEPIIDQDWGLHFHHLKSMQAFWQQDHRLWGYNPFFMAGYPSNTIQDLSIKFFEFVALGLSTLALMPIQWFKISTFLAMACVPWLMYFAARNCFDEDEVKNNAAPLAAILGTIYWWNSLPREMFFYGMVGYPPGSYLAVLGVTMFYRIAKEPSSWSPAHIGWLVFAVIILPLHVQALMVFLPPVLAVLIAQPRLLTGRLLIWVAGATALSLAANSIWLVPALYHLGDDISSALVEQLPLFVSGDPFTVVKDYLGPQGYWTFRPAFWEKGFRLTILVMGSLAALKLIRSEHRPLGIMLSGALIVLFSLAYFGSMIPWVKGWQPLRFKIPLDLFLVLASAYVIALWLRSRSAAPSSSLVPLLLLGGAVAFLFNLVQTESQGKMILRTRLAPELSAVREWISKETPPAARVLFEESGDETGFVYNGVYLSSFVPHWTGRELIGGPINLYNDRHHFAEFHSGKLFQRDIGTLSDDELRNYLRLYNIGAVVSFHPASLKKLTSIPGLVTIDQQVGPIHLMKVNQPLSWFVEGEGKVQAGANRLELRDLKGSEIVLKYHWVEGLSATPAVQLAPTKLADDPIPFIKLIDPPSSLVLKLR